MRYAINLKYILIRAYLNNEEVISLVYVNSDFCNPHRHNGTSSLLKHIVYDLYS